MDELRNAIPVHGSTKTFPVSVNRQRLEVTLTARDLDIDELARFALHELPEQFDVQVAPNVDGSPRFRLFVDLTGRLHEVQLLERADGYGVRLLAPAKLEADRVRESAELVLRGVAGLGLRAAVNDRLSEGLLDVLIQGDESQCSAAKQLIDRVSLVPTKLTYAAPSERVDWPSPSEYFCLTPAGQLQKRALPGPWPTSRRVFGFMKGELQLPPGLEEPLPDDAIPWPQEKD